MNTDRFKFRVWDKKEKEKEYKPCAIFWDGEVYDCDITTCYIGAVAQEPERYIVEQCTGLKDKNGKLIFEGDIVKTDIGEIGVVVFFDAQFAVRFENAFYCSVAEAKEIIGNIHEMEKSK